MADHFISRADAQNDMAAAAAYIAEAITSADGRAEGISAVLPIYLERKEVDLAAELANTVDDPYTRDRLLSAVAHRCAELDDREYARQLADAIEDDGVRSNAFEKMALAFADAGDLEAANEVADELPHPEFVIAGVAARRAEKGDIAGATASLDAIDYSPAKVAGFLQSAAAVIDKDRDAAAAMLSSALELAPETDHAEESIRAMCDIGNLLIEAKRNDLAVGAFQQARDAAEVLDSGHKDFFLINAALGFLFAGSEELADSTLDLVTDKTQMSSALLGYAREQWRKDRKEDAVDTLDEAFEILRSQKDIETRDSRARNTLMTTIAVQFAGFGKTDKGIDAAHANADEAETASAMAQIAAILVTQNEDELARDTVGQIDNEDAQIEGLFAIADSAHVRGDDELALKWLDEASAAIDALPQVAARADALTKLTERYLACGDTEKARNGANRCLDQIAQIRDETRRVVALSSLSSNFGENALPYSDVEKNALQTLISAS